MKLKLEATLMNTPKQEVFAASIWWRYNDPLFTVVGKDRSEVLTKIEELRDEELDRIADATDSLYTRGGGIHCMSEPCMCGDTDCPSCGLAQGTLEDKPMYTTQKQVRRAFWQAWRDGHFKGLHVTPRTITDSCGFGKMHNTDTRCAFCDFVDRLSKNGELAEGLADRVTLS